VALGLAGVVSGAHATMLDLTPDLFILTSCKETESPATDPMSATEIVDPATLLAIEVERRSKPFADFSASVASIKTTLLENTTHGKLISQPPYAGREFYRYQVDLGYLGKDKAVFMAEFQGKRYKIVMELHVVQFVDDSDNGSSCPPPKLIKVNGKPVSGASDYNLGNITVHFERAPGSGLAS
jgi:hypothetical protein